MKEGERENEERERRKGEKVPRNEIVDGVQEGKMLTERENVMGCGNVAGTAHNDDDDDDDIDDKWQ
mgnify:CR=1 FL=1